MICKKYMFIYIANQRWKIVKFWGQTAAFIIGTNKQKRGQIYSKTKTKERKEKNTKGDVTWTMFTVTQFRFSNLSMESTLARE